MCLKAIYFNFNQNVVIFLVPNTRELQNLWHSNSGNFVSFALSVDSYLLSGFSSKVNVKEGNNNRLLKRKDTIVAWQPSRKQKQYRKLNGEALLIKMLYSLFSIFILLYFNFSSFNWIFLLIK